MVNAKDIVLIIQNIPINSPNMRFLISLANNAYNYNNLTPKQEEAFINCVNTLKEKGVLA